MKSVFILFALLLSCAPVPDSEYGTDWQMAPVEYTWTVEQAKQIQDDCAWCIENTDYNKNYCYGTAIMRRGTLKKREVVK